MNKPRARASDISFGYLLSDVTLLFRKHFDRRSTRFGLTRAQWRAIRCLHDRTGIRQRELAEFLEMGPIAVGRLVDRLESAGFVERRRDPGDRRCWRLRATAKARAVVDDMRDIAEELRADATAGIGTAELRRMIATLTRIKDNLRRREEPPEQS